MDIREELIRGTSLYELPLRVTFYARVSTDNDTQTSSITNQIAYFNKLITSIKNWHLIPGYIDEGISGKDTKKREKFLKMIKDGLNNKFDFILTKSVSRFARNTIDSIKYTDLLKNKGVGVFFINDNINTFNNDSEFRLTLMASIAQDEIRKLSESVKFGLKQSIDRGIVLGNNNILGYKKNNGKLIIDKKEAQIVKDIYILFSKNNYNYTNLAKIINKKYNKQFDSTSIKRILTNYKYKGYYCGRKSTVIDYKNNKRKKIDPDNWIIYKDYAKVPPIITENLWNKVNKIILKRNKKKLQYQTTYQNKIICYNHNRTYKHIIKKYKNKHYSYFVCPKCTSIKEEIITKITNNRNIEKIIIEQKTDYLKIILKINT